MKSQKEISKKVDKTFGLVDQIEAPRVSPFFKEKVMQQIRTLSDEIEVKPKFWFTPQLQLATFVCVVVLNIYALINLNNTSFEDNASQLAETYGWSSETTETTFFN